MAPGTASASAIQALMSLWSPSIIEKVDEPHRDRSAPSASPSSHRNRSAARMFSRSAASSVEPRQLTRPWSVAAPASASSAAKWSACRRRAATSSPRSASCSMPYSRIVSSMRHRAARRPPRCSSDLSTSEPSRSATSGRDSRPVGRSTAAALSADRAGREDGEPLEQHRAPARSSRSQLHSTTARSVRCRGSAVRLPPVSSRKRSDSRAGDLGQRQRPQPGRGELDGQRQAVQAAHDLDDRRHRGVVDREVGAGGRGAVGEQPHRRVLERHRGDAASGAGWPSGGTASTSSPMMRQRLAAGGQDAQLRAAAEQLLGQRRGGVDEVLAVVEHQHRVPVGRGRRPAAPRRLRRAPLPARRSSRFFSRSPSAPSTACGDVAPGRSPAPARPARPRPRLTSRAAGLGGQPRLAGAAGPTSVTSRCSLQRLADPRELLVAADEAGERRAQVGAPRRAGSRRSAHLAAQHGQVGGLQLGGRVHAELVGQPRAHPLVGAQRVGLPAGARPGRGTSCPASRSSSGCSAASASSSAHGTRPRRPRSTSAARRSTGPPSRRSSSRRRGRGDAPRRRRPAPGRATAPAPRAAGPRRGPASPSRSARGPCAGQPLEAVRVDVVGRDRQPVAGRRLPTSAAAARARAAAARPGDCSALRRVGRRLARPTRRRSARPAGTGRPASSASRGQQRPQPRAGDLDRGAVAVAHLERAEDPHLHRTTVPRGRIGGMRSETIDVRTGGHAAVHDLTDAVRRVRARRADGLLSVFVPHATAGLAVIETGAGSDDDLLARGRRRAAPRRPLAAPARQPRARPRPRAAGVRRAVARPSRCSADGCSWAPGSRSAWSTPTSTTPSGRCGSASCRVDPAAHVARVGEGADLAAGRRRTAAVRRVPGAVDEAHHRPRQQRGGGLGVPRAAAPGPRGPTAPGPGSAGRCVPAPRGRRPSSAPGSPARSPGTALAPAPTAAARRSPSARRSGSGCRRPRCASRPGRPAARSCARCAGRTARAATVAPNRVPSSGSNGLSSVPKPPGRDQHQACAPRRGGGARPSG